MSPTSVEAFTRLYEIFGEAARMFELAMGHPLPPPKTRAEIMQRAREIRDMRDAELPDTGKRRFFETGAQRDSREGKGRFDLLPPLAITLLAKHFEAGARKYDARNWEKGIEMGAFIDSALRHLFAYMHYGVEKEDHLVAAAWNILAAVETRERVHAGILPPSLEDIPCVVPTGQALNDDINASGQRTQASNVAGYAGSERESHVSGDVVIPPAPVMSNCSTDMGSVEGTIWPGGLLPKSLSQLPDALSAESPTAF